MRVAIAFRLYEAGGDLIDEVTREEPMCYVHGYGEVLAGLEEGLLGAEAGEERSIVLLPEDAFGEHDENAVLEIDPQDFPEAADAKVGGEIVATGPDGVEAVHRIIAVDEDAIVVDLNHPFAGEILRFETTVCEVRPATDEELDAAQADVDGRIALVYGSQSEDLAEPAPAASLVQLRVPQGHKTQARKSTANEETDG